MDKKWEGTAGGISRLANVIDGRVRRQAETPSFFDFGTIKKNGSLLTDAFPEMIAKGEYSMLEGFRHDGNDTRVLVAWAGDGEAVVIGKLDGE